MHDIQLQLSKTNILYNILLVDKIPPSGDLIFNKPIRNTIKPLTRSESCFSHYYLGKPKMHEVNRHARINIFKGVDGELQLEKQAFES